MERKWKQKDINCTNARTQKGLTHSIPLRCRFSVSSICLNAKKDLLLNKIPWKHLCLSYAQGEEQVGWFAKLAYALLVLIYTFGTHGTFTSGMPV